MQAQYEHSPPTRRSSTIATFSPCWASRPAATSPPGPAPTTTTSKLRMEEHPNSDYNEVSKTTLGTTGFDVVGSWGRLRVEVPEASLNPGKTISAKSNKSAVLAHDYALTA